MHLDTPHSQPISIRLIGSSLSVTFIQPPLLLMQAELGQLDSMNTTALTPNSNRESLCWQSQMDTCFNQVEECLLRSKCIYFEHRWKIIRSVMILSRYWTILDPWYWIHYSILWEYSVLNLTKKMMTEKSESERAQKPFSCTIDRCFLKATKKLFFRDRMQTIPVLLMVQALHEIHNLMTSVPSIYFNTMGCADWDLWRSNSATALANRIAECQCRTFPLCTSADFCITTHCALMYYSYTSISQVH